MAVSNAYDRGANSKKRAKSTALKRLSAAALAFAILCVLALATILMIPRKIRYNYYLVHSNSGLDLKMRLSDEWIMTKPYGSNSFKGDLREVYMGKESGCEFVRKKPNGFMKFLSQIRFPFMQTPTSGSRINLFPTTHSPAYKGITLSQIRDESMDSDAKSYGDRATQNGAYVKHVNVGCDALKIGPAFTSETVYPGGRMAGQPEDVAKRRSYYDFVVYAPMNYGARWITIRVHAGYPTVSEGVIKGEIQDLASHLEVVGERPLKLNP